MDYPNENLEQQTSVTCEGANDTVSEGYLASNSTQTKSVGVTARGRQHSSCLIYFPHFQPTL